MVLFWKKSVDDMRGVPRIKGYSDLEPGDRERFHIEIFVDAVARAFAAEAGLFHAAEGRGLRRDEASVDADDAVFECLGHAPDPADVASVEIGREAVLGGVGEGDRF